MGESIAIDGSDLPAYANGQRFASKNGRERAASEYSDPDASWAAPLGGEHPQGRWYYGYKVHAAVDTLTGLPMAWEVRTARDAETTVALRTQGWVGTILGWLGRLHRGPPLKRDWATGDKPSNVENEESFAASSRSACSAANHDYLQLRRQDGHGGWPRPFWRSAARADRRRAAPDAQ